MWCLIIINMAHCSLAIGKWICALPKRGIWCSSKCMGWKFTDWYVTFCAKSVIAKTNSGHPRLLANAPTTSPKLPPPRRYLHLLNKLPYQILSQVACHYIFIWVAPQSSICLHLYSHFILGIKCLFPLYPRHKMLPESRPPLHLAFVFSDCTFLIDSFFYGLSSI